MPKQTYQDHLKPEFKELDSAIDNGNLGEVKRLINAKNINSVIDTKAENTPLIAAAAHGQFEIVKYLIEQGSNINALYKVENKYNQSALRDAIKGYCLNAYGKGESYLKIALILIQEGADITLPTVTTELQQLKVTDPLRKLIETRRELDTKKENVSLMNEIGNIYCDEFKNTEEGLKWYLKAAQNGNHFGMWNYGISLVRLKTNLREAYQWISKSFPSWTAEKDKLEIMETFENILNLRNQVKENKEHDLMPQDQFNLLMLMADYYLQKEDKEKGWKHLVSALKISQEFASLTLSPVEEKLLQAVSILTGTQIEFPLKQNESKDTTTYLSEYIQVTQLLTELAGKNSATALNILILNLKKGTTSLPLRLAISHYLRSLPLLPLEVKKECEKIIAEEKDFFNGITALYGLDRKSNASEAIKIFENLAKTGKYSARAYLHSAAGHCQIALKTTEEDERSERITKAIKTYELLKNHCQDYDTPNKKFSRTDLYDQILRFISISKKESDSLQLIKILLDFYKTEAVNKEFFENRLRAVMYALQKNEFLKSNLTAWKLTLETLLDCHQQTNKSELFKIHLQEFARISETCDPKFQFFAKKALADCYNRYEDKSSLQSAIQNYENAQNISAQAEEKFSLESYRETYKRFGETLRSNASEEAIAAFNKAGEFGDVEASLLAAAIAEVDEQKIDTAIAIYKKAMQDALVSNDMKNIISTIKQILTFKDKLDLSSKRTAEIETIICSAQEKLNTTSLIQSHLKELSEILTLAKRVLPDEKVNLLFANYVTLANETAAQEQLTQLASGTEVIKNLLTEFEKNVEAKNTSQCDKIKSDIFQYITTYLNKEKRMNPTDDLIDPVFHHIAKNDTVIQLQKELISSIEKHLQNREAKDCYATSNLANLYMYLVSKKENPLRLTGPARSTTLLKMIEKYKITILHPDLKETDKYYSKANLVNMTLLEKDTFVVEQAQNALDYINYKHTPGKNLVQSAKRNFLPAVYDIFKSFNKPEHIRRPLYLAAKILLLSLDKKSVEKRFDLSTAQIDIMINEATTKLRNVAATNLKNVKPSSETYQYARLAQWYLEIIENAKGMTLVDPDAFLFQAAAIDQPIYDMNQIRMHIKKGMKQALDVNDKWIAEKMTSVVNETATSPLSADAKEVSKPVVLESKTVTKHIVQIEQPATIHMPEPSVPLKEVSKPLVSEPKAVSKPVVQIEQPATIHMPEPSVPLKEVSKPVVSEPKAVSKPIVQIEQPAAIHMPKPSIPSKEVSKSVVSEPKAVSKPIVQIEQPAIIQMPEPSAPLFEDLMHEEPFYQNLPLERKAEVVNTPNKGMYPVLDSTESVPTPKIENRTSVYPTLFASPVRVEAIATPVQPKVSFAVASQESAVAPKALDIPIAPIIFAPAEVSKVEHKKEPVATAVIATKSATVNQFDEPDFQDMLRFFEPPAKAKPVEVEKEVVVKKKKAEVVLC